MHNDPANHWINRLGISNLSEDQSSANATWWSNYHADMQYRAEQRARIEAGIDALRYRRETAPQERPRVVYGDTHRKTDAVGCCEVCGLAPWEWDGKPCLSAGPPCNPVEANLTISSARGHGEMLDLIEQMERLMLAGIRHFTVRVED